MQIRFNWPASTLILVAATLALSGCSTAEPSLSPEEARAIAAGLESVAIDPPPRDANDVITILDETPLVTDIRYSTARRTVAQTPPPADAPPNARFGYHYRAGLANELLGRYNDAYVHLSEALALADNGTVKATFLEVGNTARARAMMSLVSGNGFEIEESFARVEQIRSSNPWHLTSQSSYLALHNMFAGDLARAREEIKFSRAVLNGLNKQSVSSHHWGMASLVDGLLALEEGRNKDASALFADAIAEFEGNLWGEMGFIPWATVMMAEAKLREGRLAEAEYLSRKAIKSISQTHGPSSALNLLALSTLINIYNDQRRYEAAQALGKRALQIVDGRSIGELALPVIRMRESLIQSALAGGRYSDVLSETDRLLADIGRAGHTSFLVTPYGAQILSMRGMSALRRGRPDVALDAFESYATALGRTRGNDDPDVKLALGMIAAAHTGLGNLDAAREAFDLAIPSIIDQIVSEQNAGQRHMTILELRMVIDWYLRFLRKEGVTPAKVESAFRVAEASRSRKVSGSVLTALVRDGKGASIMLQQSSDIAQRILALEGALANALTHSESKADAIGVSLTKLRANRDKLQRELIQSDPNFQAFAAGQAPAPQEVAEHLAPDEVLLSQFVGADTTTVWAVLPDGTVRQHTAMLSEETVRGYVHSLRRGVSSVGVDTVGEIRPFDLQAAYVLFSELYAPVLRGLDGTKRLIVVPDDIMASVPPSLLVMEMAAEPRFDDDGTPFFSEYRDVAWLARRYAVSVSPSVSAFVGLRTRAEERSITVAYLGLGDPVFSPGQADKTCLSTSGNRADRAAIRGIQLCARAAPASSQLRSVRVSDLPPLPDTREEVVAAAEAIDQFGASLTILGQEATEQRLTSQSLDDFQILHFATHGLIPGDLDGLYEPALAMTPGSPFSRADDGLLTMSEVARLSLDADWVVLSACNTGSADGRASEAYSGLGAAFFYAGSRTVILSNWPVHSRPTTELMTGFFSTVGANAAAADASALQRARVNLIEKGVFRLDDGTIAYSYAHPIFWAPFTMVGAPGRTASPQS